MTENVYEGLFILDSEQYARNPDEVSSQIDRQIGQYQGEVLVSRLWEERRLAYPVKGHRRGTYWLTYFRLDAAKVKELNRQFQISEGILRFLLLKVDPRLVDALVEHAKSGPLHPVSEITEDVPGTLGNVLEDGGGEDFVSEESHL